MRFLRALSGVIAALSLVVATAAPVSTHSGPNHQEDVWGLLVNFHEHVDEDTVWGKWRIQFPGTYNWDGIISASVRDVHTDGNCVWAVYRDGGQNFHQAQSCRHWTNHLFFDQTGNSWAQVRVNRPGINDPVDWRVIVAY